MFSNIVPVNQQKTQQTKWRMMCVSEEQSCDGNDDKSDDNDTISRAGR